MRVSGVGSTKIEVSAHMLPVLKHSHLILTLQTPGVKLFPDYQHGLCMIAMRQLAVETAPEGPVGHEVRLRGLESNSGRYAYSPTSRIIHGPADYLR